MNVAMRHPARVILDAIDHYHDADCLDATARALLADAAMGALMAAGWIDEETVRAMEAPDIPTRA